MGRAAAEQRLREHARRRRRSAANASASQSTTDDGRGMRSCASATAASAPSEQDVLPRSDHRQRRPADACALELRHRQGCAARARRRGRAAPRRAGEGSFGTDGDQRHAAVDYTDAVRKERRELPRAERVERRRRSHARAARGRALPTGSQCANGTSVCTSSGKKRFGVVTKTRRAIAARARARTAAAPRVPPATCSTTAFEKPRSNCAVGERQVAPVGLHGGHRPGRPRGTGRAPCSPTAVILLRPRVERLEEVVGRARFRTARR